MADITKKIPRSIQSPVQWWSSSADQNDSGSPIAAGDIFKLGDSLNGPASEIIITTTAAGSMSFRLNPVVTVYPARPPNQSFYSDNNYFLASGVTFTDTSQTPIVIQASSTLTLPGPINDLQLVTNSGVFSLLAKR